jgi:hypothetical protein
MISEAAKARNWWDNPKGFWRNPWFDMERFWKKLAAEIAIALVSNRTR